MRTKLTGLFKEEFFMATLYTTDCPKCKVLEKVLSDKNIAFQTVTDLDVMMSKGFMSAPMLECDGQVYTFSEAMQRYL